MTAGLSDGRLPRGRGPVSGAGRSGEERRGGGEGGGDPEGRGPGGGGLGKARFLPLLAPLLEVVVALVGEIAAAVVVHALAVLGQRLDALRLLRRLRPEHALLVRHAVVLISLLAVGLALCLPPLAGVLPVIVLELPVAGLRLLLALITCHSLAILC